MAMDTESRTAETSGQIVPVVKPPLEMKRERQRRYHAKNREKIAQRKREWRAAHKGDEKRRQSAPSVKKRKRDRERLRTERLTADGKKKKRDAIAKSRSKTAFAMNHRAFWKAEELRLIFDNTKTDRELSQLLDRSMNAIHNARIRHRHMAPKNWRPKGYQRIEDSELA